MIMHEYTKEQITSLIFNKYNTFLLSRKDTAEIVGVSMATLDRWKKDNRYLKYKKVGKAKNASIKYPLDGIVEYLFENMIKVSEFS